MVRGMSMETYVGGVVRLAAVKFNPGLCETRRRVTYSRDVKYRNWPWMMRADDLNSFTTRVLHSNHRLPREKI